MPQVSIFLRHPEVPAHHTTATAACTSVRGPRRMAAPQLLVARYSASPGPSPFEARPAEEAGLAPQGDGEGESLVAAGNTSTLSKNVLASGFGRVQRHGGANERLQRPFINLVALMEIDGTPGVAFEAGVEEA